MRVSVALAGSAVFFLFACATLPPPQPSSLDHGLLIARATTRGAMIPFLVSEADAGIINAVDELGVPVPGMSAVSRLATEGYIVFFDLPAGRYVLRSTFFLSRGVRYQFVAAEEDKAISRGVVLRSGTAAFLGAYDYDALWPEFKVGIGRMARIVGHWLTPWKRRPLLPRDVELRSSNTSAAAEAAALRAVRGALLGTQWRRIIDARLRELSLPDPAKTEGKILSRELPLRQESVLAWRDTLRWGEPRRAASGLAWSRPDSEAQIAVFFTSAAAPGFAGWNAALGELRRAATASVEDTGELYEVRVATRIGQAARTTSYHYPKATLVGSKTTVMITETVLVPAGDGVFTARLRAPRAEFDAMLPAYREFLLQLVLSPRKENVAVESEVLPGLVLP